MARRVRKTSYHSRRVRRSGGFDWGELPWPQLSGAIVAGAVFLTFAYLGVAAMREPRPNEMGCYPSLPHAEAVIFFDWSLPRWSPQQAGDLKEHFSDFLDRLEFNTRVTVLTTEGDQIGSIQDERFSACVPARSSAEMAAAGLRAMDDQFLVRQFDRGFRAEFEAVIEAIVDSSGANPGNPGESPILESMASISWRDDFDADIRTLVVTSDLIQNTYDTARFCTQQGDLPRFERFVDSPGYRRNEPRSLAGTEIEFLFLQRPGYGVANQLQWCHQDELTSFWEAWAVHNGASSVRTIALRHGVSQDDP
jgi:hypothetical protein